MNQTAQSWWFIFYKDQLLLEKKERVCQNALIYRFTPVTDSCNRGKFLKKGVLTQPPCKESSPIVIKEETTVHNITTLERRNCKAFSLSSPIEESEQWVMIGLRASYEYLPLSHYQTAGKAHEILHWDRNSRFCSACGTPMEQKESIMKRCPKCDREVYPSISTAILVLVRKKDSLLLVHARNFKGTFNSLVAGFLETGETLEECVAREVKEETGLDVKNITYFGNQPWPYPSGLMVGFIADYAGGEINLQDEELSSGDFYTRDNLPELPRKLSLARKMIDWWIEHPNEQYGINGLG